MATVSIRYIVHDVAAAIGFYTGHRADPGRGPARSPLIS
jgi:hypothetical protein